MAIGSKTTDSSGHTVPKTDILNIPGPNPQMIEWEANYLGSGPPEGNGFYLHKVVLPGVNPNFTEVPLEENLRLGRNCGAHLLDPGMYKISTAFQGMGRGTYVVRYNLQLSMGISPTSQPFGELQEGLSSPSTKFTLKKTGDVDLQISSINISSDNPAAVSRFKFVGAVPVNQKVGTGFDLTFQVKFDAGTVAGDWNAKITVKATPLFGCKGEAGSSSVTAEATLSGRTKLKQPNISCKGGSCGAATNIGSADGDVGEVAILDMAFQNTGSIPLQVRTISLAPDSASVFSLEGTLPPVDVSPGLSHIVKIRFAPGPGSATYCGSLVIESNDPDEQTKQCYFFASSRKVTIVDPEPPSKGPTAQGDDMLPGEVLNLGQSLSSVNGQYTLEFQRDGNLVLFRNKDKMWLWASGTAGKHAQICLMHPDGNLIIKNPRGLRLWSSGTFPQPDSHLLVQNDGNVVIYRPDGFPVWATDTPQPVMVTGPPASGDTMRPGEVLNPGQSLTSVNGQFTFIFQFDGNLVLYRNKDSEPLWASGTEGTLAAVCVMQQDGNLVIYDTEGRPLWASDTPQRPDSRLVAQNDGNVVIYRPDGFPVWATDTVQPFIHELGPPATGDTMRPGEVLNPGQSINSADQRFTFIFQFDGNLVLYRNADNVALWASGTDGKPAAVCIMQQDGNLVIYDTDGQPLWASDTPQHPDSRLVVQNDGNVVIYQPDGFPVWATDTVQE